MLLDGPRVVKFSIDFTDSDRARVSIYLWFSSGYNNFLQMIFIYK